MPRKGGEETLFRLLTMLELIPKKGKKGTAQLKRELEDRGFVVELRTVQRDLKSLEEKSIFPIESDNNNPAGWKWSETANTFDIPKMDPLEALSLNMMEQYITRMLPKNCLVFLESHFRRASTILQDVNLRWLRTWPKKIGLISRSQPLLPAKINPEILEEITEGLLRDRQIKIQYRRKGEEIPADGIINPLGLVFKDHVVYLVCTYWKYTDIRHLALHRIQGAEVLDESISKLEGFDLGEHIKSEAFGILEGEAKIKLKAIFYGSEDSKEHPATHLKETPLSPDQRIINLGDGELQVEATVKDTSQLRWWLQGFGSQVEVLAPKKLREEFKVAAKRLANIYK